MAAKADKNNDGADDKKIQAAIDAIGKVLKSFDKDFSAVKKMQAQLDKNVDKKKAQELSDALTDMVDNLKPLENANKDLTGALKG